MTPNPHAWATVAGRVFHILALALFAAALIRTGWPS
jgi:hypothetical protein